VAVTEHSRRESSVSSRTFRLVGVAAVVLVVAAAVPFGLHALTSRDRSVTVAAASTRGVITPSQLASATDESNPNAAKEQRDILDSVENYFAKSGVSLYDIGFSTVFKGLVITVNRHDFDHAREMAPGVGVQVHIDSSGHEATPV